MVTNSKEQEEAIIADWLKVIEELKVWYPIAQNDFGKPSFAGYVAKGEPNPGGTITEHGYGCVNCHGSYRGKFSVFPKPDISHTFWIVYFCLPCARKLGIAW